MRAFNLNVFNLKTWISLFRECFFQSFSYAQAAQESQFHIQEQAIVLNSIEGILIQEYIIEISKLLGLLITSDLYPEFLSRLVSPV
ncbi:hypothetical protein K0M31_015765 [Melipona bicolor]|uniref:Uncharacterized protein n=1 Tax=Melipona bicolor TaxID=60889 RepID=A0AA40FEX4_9HYME|nr:hypothetical protein K0M31_015765 [Melipona bicolor]